jgi:hypothetical protein
MLIFYPTHIPDIEHLLGVVYRIKIEIKINNGTKSLHSQST